MWQISLISVFLGACTAVFGQANLSISVARSNDLVNVEWDVRSLVPAPGAPVFAGYRIMVSSNFTDWEQLGEIIRGNEFLNQRVRQDFNLTGRSWRFVKVESLLNFSGFDIIGLLLDGANFERAQFSGCDFFGSSLDGANLRKAIFEAADFRAASLAGADLTEGNFTGTLFFQANLENASARDANLTFTDFTGANLRGANLKGADLRFSSLLPDSSEFISLHHTLIDENTRFSEKNELIWKIVNDKMMGATLSNVDLTISDLSDANLESAILRQVDLRGSSFERTKLSGADLTQANVDFVDWRGADASNAVLTAKAMLIWQLNNQDFSGKNLGGKDLSNSSLFRAGLDNTILTNVNFQRAILVEARLQGADLRGANFTDADLSGADLRDANMANVNLRNTDLTRADLRKAKISNPFQSGTIFRDTIMPDGTIRNPSP